IHTAPSHPEPNHISGPIKGGSMWTKQQSQTENPAAPPVQSSGSPVVPFSAPSTARLGSSSAHNSARLGAGLQIKGHITGTEDLQIDGKVDGPISLNGHE